MKRITGIVIVVLFMMFLINTVAFADTLEPVDGTDYSQISQEASVDEEAISGAGKKAVVSIAESNTQLVYSSNTAIATSSTKAGWCQLDNMSSFNYYAQATNYSCGAACVRMALKYLTGTDYPESTVRSGCGTTSNGTYLSNMKTYINKRQNKNTYFTRFGDNKTTMQNYLYSGIVTYDAPVVMGLKETTNKGWPFDLKAHFVTIYAVKSDKSEVSIADPWAGYVSKKSSYQQYNKTIDDLYTGYSAVNCGYMYGR